MRAERKPSQAMVHGAYPPVTHYGNTYFEIRAKTIERSCKKTCPCQCHVPLQGETPRWLRGLFGDLFFSFTGTPVLNHRSCNVKSCGASPESGGAVHVRYTFPTWIFSRGIHVIGDWTDLTGMEAVWSFRVPQVITSTHIKSIILLTFKHTFYLPRLLETLASLKVRPVDELEIDVMEWFAPGVTEDVWISKWSLGPAL